MGNWLSYGLLKLCKSNILLSNMGCVALNEHVPGGSIMKEFKEEIKKIYQVSFWKYLVRVMNHLVVLVSNLVVSR